MYLQHSISYVLNCDPYTIMLLGCDSNAVSFTVLFIPSYRTHSVTSARKRYKLKSIGLEEKVAVINEEWSTCLGCCNGIVNGHTGLLVPVTLQD